MTDFTLIHSTVSPLHSADDAFLAYMRKNISVEYASDEPDVNGPCWLWTGPKNTQGYGLIGSRRFTGEARNGGLAHRAVFTQYKGDIPAGYTINHRCYVRRCVNPRHTEILSYGANIQDGFNRKARNALVAGFTLGAVA